MPVGWILCSMWAASLHRFAHTCWAGVPVASCLLLDIGLACCGIAVACAYGFYRLYFSEIIAICFLFGVVVCFHTLVDMLLPRAFTMYMYDSAGCLLLLFVIVTGHAYNVCHWLAYLLPHALTIWDVTGHAWFLNHCFLLRYYYMWEARPGLWQDYTAVGSCYVIICLHMLVESLL